MSQGLTQISIIIAPCYIILVSMKDSYKEQLSKHVEDIFKQYAEEGLHICDIATGGGKSYTIGKLTCEYYPQYFDRIVILCVQNKLVDSMNKEIEKFISSDNSLICSEEKLIIEKNTETIKKSIDTDSFRKFLQQVEYRIDEFNGDVSELRYCYNHIKKTYEGVKNLIVTQSNSNSALIQGQIDEGESKLRYYVRNFFDTYKKHILRLGGKHIEINNIIKKFPSLVDVYPQVDYKKKTVLLMTVHKAMYGIDPILSEKVSLNDLAEKGKRTLIIFDESDQAAIAMRNAIIEQAIDKSDGNRRFAKGYNGYLQYKQLIDMADHVSNEYYGMLLDDNLKKTQSIITKNWEKVLGQTEPYKNIFLGKIEDLEDFRRGVFFSGPALKLNVSRATDKTHSFFCYRKGEKQFKLFHVLDDAELKKMYDYVVPMDKFLSLIIGNTIVIKAQLCKVINEAYSKSIEEFDKSRDEIATNNLSRNHYLGYPTREREIHTLISRFEINSEYQYEQQLYDFMTNRKNMIVVNGKDKLKLPDYSVYSQGVQLYQEEVDERDNQHRVRLSCREITTTPEKILIDLVCTEKTSVVLCSATASSSSVISNFDIAYLKESVGNKVHSLSEADCCKFDELVALTYPKQHKIVVCPLEHYKYEDIRENNLSLPERYKSMFSKEAQEEGLADMWFRCTRRELIRNKREDENITFYLYRLYQFIEAYHWFVNNGEVRSMIFFQNRNGNPIQANVLSCLIDGSYKKQKTIFDEELPTDWKNEHVEISKDWEEVEGSILKKLSESKDSKIMLISAYASFKAGANMQYDIPNDLDFLPGDNWEKEGEQLKKDWDAVYLQCPKAYLTMNEDGNEITYEKSLYNAMLSLMMLYERGCFSRGEVSSWLYKAISNKFRFGDQNNPGITRDKAAWAQTVVEQAVGRLCRTRNKPHVTYILFDEDIAMYINKDNLKKSLTKEFKVLADYILSHPKESNIITLDSDEIVRCNNANYAKRQLDRMRTIALKYTPHPNREELFDDDIEDDNSIPRNVQINQIMNQSYKQTIIRKPVIADLNELTEENKHLTFICKCYGDWHRNEKNEYFFSYDPNHYNYICPQGKGRPYPEPISTSSVRLDILMKNDVIRNYFEKQGYATDWKPGGLILHPEILKTDYAGEIGEEAFKAIILHYTDCNEENFKHLEGRYYEYADFVICNPDGSYKVAFDVKNMNPNIDHLDKQGELPTAKKRREKRKCLGCQLITVSMLQLPNESMDDLTEIHGIIDNEGNVNMSSIDYLKRLISAK